ncbi:hypothetical protein Ade02nite_71510 [Paractinoplanes deccanensis]|uniref:DUF4389 domain-containing protein n=1 Tax=Paractinoplanes deccanensis TaxID=113561 RepID=A0ABQ3YFB8_9ACTN|nr:DUF4389 domain-containing protein [Actinoplanes deccanensis]GID78510.1 hypothetical protein Ade02nite_71510 [Actinoplanes deccanensis]
MNRFPLRVEARRDAAPSRWLWLVKWLLLIPHYIVLLVLWTGLVVLTLVAYLAVLFTGRYPAAIRAYNLGVLRWGWRVGYYGYQALGTDRYPPFTLADDPAYPARLHLEPDGPPPRWLPLVAWLFAIPHLVLLGALTGAATRQNGVPVSVVGAAVLIAGFALLFTARYPGGLHDLLVGIARWNLRVAAYLTLLTPRYPPFRLDQGGAEPDEPPPDEPVRAAPPRAGSAAGPVVALVAGVLLLAPAAGTGIGGAVLLGLDASRDGAGYVTSPAVQLSTATAAVTAENLTITDAGLWTRNVADVGGLRVTATSPSGRPLFVGIAPESAVDTWLAGTAHDELAALRSGEARYHRADGVTRSLADPAAQPFWISSATGPGTTTLEWNVTDGNYAVVVANLDGTPGVAADVRGGIQVPDLTGLGAGLLTTGIVLGAVAIGLIVLGGVGLGRRHTEPPPPAAGPAGPAPQKVPPATVGS